ncbi:hypothetical protein [Pseudarthrobacter sulfonivorans]|nr:hypothetical protein [Pseudarthrobacter sulfonivorans]
MENDMICDAWLEGPKGKTRYEAPAPFQRVRVADTNQYLCPDHLGPVLMHGANLTWPPEIEWLSPDERPYNSLSPEQAERKFEAFMESIQGGF